MITNTVMTVRNIAEPSSLLVVREMELAECSPRTAEENLLTKVH